MTKFLLNRADAPWDYPSLGFRADTATAILDGSLSTPAITTPPDAYWSVYVGGSAETGITRYGNPTGPDPATETADGSTLMYADASNRFVPKTPEEFFANENVASVLSATLDDQVDRVDDLLVVKGTQVAPEEVGAEPVASELFIPAADFYAYRGSVGPTFGLLNGCPVMTFPKRAKFADSFNRASLGTTADTGQTYTAANGGWAITSNKLLPATSAGARVTLPGAGADGQSHIIVGALPGTGDCMIVRRFTDASNYISLVVRSTGAIQLAENVASTSTTVLASSATGLVTAGAKVTLRSYGTALYGLINDVVVLTATTSVTSGTAIGLRNGSDTTGTFAVDSWWSGDNDMATALATVPATWEAFSVSVLFANTVVTGGDARWDYAEGPVDLTGTTILTTTDIGSVTISGISSTIALVQEGALASPRPAPANGLAVIGLGRSSVANGDTTSTGDTVAASLAVLGVMLREVAA